MTVNTLFLSLYFSYNPFIHDSVRLKIVEAGTRTHGGGSGPKLNDKHTNTDGFGVEIFENKHQRGST